MSKASLGLIFNKWRKTPDQEIIPEFYLIKMTQRVNRTSPILKGKFIFCIRGNRLVASKIELKKGNMTKYMTYKSFKETYFPKIEYLMVPIDQSIPARNEFIEFTQKEKLPYPRAVNLCPSCLANYQRITLIPKNEVIEYYGKKICQQCALEDIREEFIKRGIELTDSTTSFYRQQLKRTKSVEKTISLLETKRQRYSDESTLFDIIPADTSFPLKPISTGLKQIVEKGILDQKVIDVWISKNYKYLLPVQQLAIKEGLFDYQDMLVVAGTSSGKTFVGELAGISTIFRKKTKFVFLTPLVALTNQKYEQFKQLYRKVGLRVAIRVGMTKINVRNQEKVIIDGSIEHADIIVATYEAFDWILRSKQYKKMGDIGCLVIDEVQLLGDEERGQELDGIIARTRQIYPHCQVIALSATIGNKEELAQDLKMSLVSYNHRPIPLERHLVFAEKEDEKPKIISELIKEGLQEISSTGFVGRSLVFTNSRRRAQELSSFFRGEGIRSTYYHAGLTYYERKKIEQLFDQQKVDVIVTTAALGAGVDFPVSQVILEKPSMGAKWLTVAEFHQMYGRAGRYGYHDKGKVFLVVTPGAKLYAAMDRSEETVAFDLLIRDVEPVDVEIDYDREMEQVLAGISSLRPIGFHQLKKYYHSLLYNTKQLNNMLLSLNNYGMAIKNNQRIQLTHLGKSIAESFLDPKVGYSVAKRLLHDEVLDIVVDLAPFKALHLSPKAHAEMEQGLKFKIPSRFLSDPVLEGITQGTNFSKSISKPLTQRMKTWHSEFLDCTCKENPYCRHPLQKITRLMIALRQDGLGPVEINYELMKQYELMAFPGDIFSWLEELVHAIETTIRISKAMKLAKKEEDAKALLESIAQTHIYQQRIKKRKHVPKKKRSVKKPANAK